MWRGATARIAYWPAAGSRSSPGEPAEEAKGPLPRTRSGRTAPCCPRLRAARSSARAGHPPGRRATR
ncbi:hypothetical protein NKG94_15255 [Micromonospora sp. M12]